MKIVNFKRSKQRRKEKQGKGRRGRKSEDQRFGAMKDQRGHLLQTSHQQNVEEGWEGRKGSKRGKTKTAGTIMITFSFLTN